MSVPLAQINLQVPSDASFTSPTRPNPPSVSPVPKVMATSVETPASAVISPSQLSTDMRVDSEHQVYYAFVDDQTGEVMFEIPPEALRAIGESLNVPMNGESGASTLDVKS